MAKEKEPKGHKELEELTKQVKEKKPKAEGKAPVEKGDKQERAAKKEAAPKEAAPKETVKTKGPTPRLKEQYRKEILPLLLKRDSYKNPMAVPRLNKIVLNMGVGEASRNIKALDYAVDE